MRLRFCYLLITYQAHRLHLGKFILGLSNLGLKFC
uniref:Uncharacterized protein n=1 Tax=Siphoviridae sp. ctZHD14 TaxID=2827891 RepID=A0A8S5SWB9_9CAUD|nr:MAG TPA: hypothetical protein [Siphoviridae sp. ctZHD14]